MSLTRRDFTRSGLMFGLGAVSAHALRPERVQDSAAYTGSNSLRTHADARGLMVGTAVDPARLDVENLSATTDAYTLTVREQSNIVVAENAMKWEALRPTPETYDYTLGDRLLSFAEQTGMRMRGHNLCWYQALPAWFASTATKQNARKLLVDHITHVAGHYAGKLQSWDVVNEAIEPKDGRADGLRKSPWLDLIGPEYVDIAFATAAQVDPSTKLTYNDYDIENDTPEQVAKRAAVLLMVRRMVARGVPIHAVGVQSHLKADQPRPGAGLQAFVRELAELGLDVYVTELDVSTQKIAGGPEEQDPIVAAIYHEYLDLMLTEPNVKAVLTWGATDRYSWLNMSKDPWAVRPDGPHRGLPFDRDNQPVAAFFAERSAIDMRPKLIQPMGAVTAPPVNSNAPFAPFTVTQKPK